MSEGGPDGKRIVAPMGKQKKGKRKKEENNDGGREARHDGRQGEGK